MDFPEKNQEKFLSNFEAKILKTQKALIIKEQTSINWTSSTLKPPAL